MTIQYWVQDSIRALVVVGFGKVSIAAAPLLWTTGDLEIKA
ncbi:MAG: hypothetical protein P4L56_15590 [Candidatus Sulfopaludibacter sp.]|nr:hypothetical protein [Candidatus Sulfopaludibacter sp.]